MRNLQSIHHQYRVHIQAAEDKHNEQVQAIEENGRLSPTKFNKVQEDLRRGELLNHKKVVKELKKKNSDQEKKHARMVMMLDRLVDSQDNQLTHQKFEMGELLRDHTQEMEEMKKLREIELKEIDVKKVKELKELKEIQTKEVKDVTEMMKVEHDAKVQKLEEDNKVLKSQVEHFKVESKETR